MSNIVKFFSWLWHGLFKFFDWFVGIPSLVVASVAGLYSSFSSLFNTLGRGDTVISDAFSVLDSSISGFSSAVNISDSVSLAMYALSMDILFGYLVSVFAVFVTILMAVLTFFLVAVPAFIANIYVIKLTAWTIGVLFPRGFAIQGLSAIADIDIYNPVRKALSDGKYNPFLSS